VGRRWVRVAVGLGSVAIAVALLALALPAIADVSWAAIWALLSALNTGTLVGLTVLWFGGLRHGREQARPLQVERHGREVRRGHRDRPPQP